MYMHEPLCTYPFTYTQSLLGLIDFHNYLSPVYAAYNRRFLKLAAPTQFLVFHVAQPVCQIFELAFHAVPPTAALAAGAI